MKILIVDDVEINRDMLEDFLGGEYELLTAGGGLEALDILEERQSHESLDLVLLDLAMPGVDGFAVLQVMKERGWLERTPVIVISGESSREVERQSLAMGAVDFIRKPFDKHVVEHRVKNTVELFRYKRSLEAQVALKTAMLERRNERLRVQAERIEKSNEAIIDMLGTVVESRGMESNTHILRIKAFTRALAQEVAQRCPRYHLTGEQIEQIVSASALHDIGKITIPDSILMKPGKLTAEEYEHMKTHTTAGARILNQVQGAWGGDYGRVCYEICRFHHERWDGKGYPEGLEGEDIPLSAQIVSIVDVYDALVSRRCYKNAYPLDLAFKMIVTGECGDFSPDLLDCFKAVRDQFEELALALEHEG